MAAFIPLLFLSLAASTPLTAAQSRISNNITVGSSLSTHTNPNFWPSPSGRFSFGFYPEQDGFKVGIWITGIHNITVVWTANRDDSPVSDVATLFLTDKGIILGTQNQNTTISDVSIGTVSSASMLDSGNFALYNSDSRIIWQSLHSPTDTILSGQRLLAGAQLFSGINETRHSTGRFRLIMQTDGNLVLYPGNTDVAAQYAYWDTVTFGQGNNVTLNLDSYGLLYLLNGTGFNIKNLTQASSSFKTEIIYRATLDVDGVFRLYSHSFGIKNGSPDTSVIWVSNSDTCEVKGYCGLDSFCSLMDTVPTCLCPPGFDYVNPSNEHEGCERISTESDCSKIKTENVTFSILTLADTSWGDAPYASLSTGTGEECSKACLEDCNCQVALYKDGRCSKQKLPLRFGRRNMGDSVRTYVKVGNGSYIKGSPSGTTDIVSEENKKEWSKVVLIVGIALVSFSLIVCTVSGFGFLIYRNRVWKYSKILEQRNSVLKEEISLISFCYSELENATDGFKEELGRGAFGTVFKGSLGNGDRTIAVKRLERIEGQGEREFRAEMMAIGRTHHRNLIRLLGFCNEGSNRLLVYEFMSNGSLADFLFKPENRPDWNERMRIAVEIARGVLYLHEECDTQIIHCDIKPQNILMDEHLNPKISDFGISKLMKQNQTRTITAIRGTKGYVAPEWHRNVPVTVKVDVYSFGIVLLEIVCCRKSVEIEAPEDEMVLSDWVYDCFEAGELDKLVNGEEVEFRRLEKMVKVGLWCVQEDPSLRPSMKKVIPMLEGTVDIPVPPGPNTFFSAP